VLFFLALTCLAAATVGSAVAYQRGERRRLASGGARAPLLLPGHDDGPTPATKKQAPPVDDDEPTLETLAPGDVVVDGVDDWVVAATVRYREESDVWALHVLDGGARRRFLEVRPRRGGVEVAVVDVTDDLPRGQLLGGLTFQGQAFRLEGRGDARTTSTGRLDGGTSRGGVLQWARYAAAGGGVLLVEDEGGARRAFVGARVQSSSLTLMSGALNRADGGFSGAVDDD
jgi:hypothetical protein